MNAPAARDSDRADAFRRLFASKIVVLDGAMGSMIQTFKLGEAEFRGAQFKSHAHDLKGNNDLLSLTRPEVILPVTAFGVTLVAFLLVPTYSDVTLGS